MTDTTQAADLLDAQATEIDRLKTELAKYQWQPIADAPKDGTEVLCARFGESPRDGYWSVDWYRQPKDKAGFLGWGRFNNSWLPTHFMYKPPEPKP